jgi:uncharacterized protein YbgA (DUF1722 family)/uncharacterized protein YbbK (DUF523 family)
VTPPLRIGISSCLLGQKVRFDGGHKRDAFLVDTFGRYVEWVPVCPEVEVGMGTPREAVRLEKAESGPFPILMVAPKSGTDWTARMTAFVTRRVDELAALDLSGYVLKSNSPSCGLERVRIYGEGAMPTRTGRGLFAEALASRCPTLPLEEEGRLSDPRLRENFVERVFAYRRLRELFSGRWIVGDLVRFHTAHKLTVLAHQPAAYTVLGRLVADAKGRARGALQQEYEQRFMGALSRIATPKRQANVLQHIVGYFRDRLHADDRAELLSLIEDHRTGVVPLVVPITLIRHHVRRLGIEYLKGQVYLEPHPRELALRNHV